MGRVERAFIAALLALAITPALVRGEEAGRTAHAGAETARVCLNQKERRALVESGAVLRLAVALRAVKNRVSGSLVRARLCRRPDGLVYVLTVLAHDGKVVRVVVDAVKGTLVGGL